MNDAIKYSLLILLLTFSGLSAAQQNIAVIDIEAAMAKTNYAKAAFDKLQKDGEFNKNLEQYQKLGAEIKALREEARANGLTWSDEQKQAHRNKLREKAAELNAAGSRVEKQRNAVNDQVQKTLTPQVEKIVPELLKQKNIGLLINSRAVYFNAPGFDITQELLDRLNKAN